MVVIDYSTWLVAHRDVMDHVFSAPILKRLNAIRDGLEAHGYKLKLDVGKRTTRATVWNSGFRSKASHPSLATFMAYEEERIARMDGAASDLSARPLALTREG